VVGSNIFNVLFILGVSALITPLVVSKQLVKLDVPLMIGVSVLAFLLSMDGRIAFWEGAILFGGIIAYTIMTVRVGKASGETGEAVEGADRTWVNLGLIAVGLVLLVLGSQWLVSAAITIATAMGVSELVIGLTIVAAGTSMPEVATSITAAIRGQRDIAVGNVVGSNIFNILAVLGLTAMVAPGGAAGLAGGHQLRLPGDDGGGCRLPADLLRRLHDPALGRRAVPRLLRGLHRVPRLRRHRT
jgi:cation:H+ antiporter